MRLILLNHEADIYDSQDEKYEMAIAASTGELRIEEIKTWIEKKLTDKY